MRFIPLTLPAIIFTIVITVLLLGGAGLAGWYFVHKTKREEQQEDAEHERKQ